MESLHEIGVKAFIMRIVLFSAKQQKKNKKMERRKIIIIYNLHRK